MFTCSVLVLYQIGFERARVRLLCYTVTTIASENSFLSSSSLFLREKNPHGGTESVGVTELMLAIVISLGPAENEGFAWGGRILARAPETFLLLLLRNLILSLRSIDNKNVWGVSRTNGNPAKRKFRQRPLGGAFRSRAPLGPACSLKKIEGFKI